MFRVSTLNTQREMKSLKSRFRKLKKILRSDEENQVTDQRPVCFTRNSRLRLRARWRVATGLVYILIHLVAVCCDVTWVW